MRGVAVDVWLGSILRHERAVTLVGLLGASLLAWLHLIRLDAPAADMAAMGMPPMHAWTPADAGLAAAMWGAMMVAMMLPGAAPMVLTFVTINRRGLAERGGRYVDTGLFTLGYLAIWALFSLAAAAVQWGLHSIALLSHDALALTPLVGAAVLVAAGVYQLTPLKRACLVRCQTPFGFLLSEWRDGRAGAIIMGLRHGLFCLGCCWVLMTLLFVGGVMNLAWVAGIAIFVLVEKLVPAGRVLSWLTGLGLIVWGVLGLRVIP